ncbi:hypothetical protein GOBAR_DD11911 [Gossypium barbadense]|nr:hypothetical protein GOBAR_DD11911 [Gossypium barbadense]
MADSATASSPLKVIAGADSFGAELKDAMVSHLRSHNIEVEDLGITSYYNIGAEVGRRVSSATTSPSVETRGLLACGTGVGVGIFANKFPGVFATTCLTPDEARNNRSINNCNVLALSGMSTSADTAKEIVDTWLNTPFKAPCPASKSQPWPEEISNFFDESMNEMPKIGASENTQAETCAVCCLVKNRELNPIDIIPGGSMKILRESPTSAIIKFKAGSVEPAHHHTFGHCLLLLPTFHSRLMADSATASSPLKVIAGADSFGAELKDAMVSHLRSHNIEVEDLGITSYYNIGAEVGRRVSSATTSPSVETRGLLACGTGVGVGIFANKFPGVTKPRDDGNKAKTCQENRVIKNVMIMRVTFQ